MIGRIVRFMAAALMVPGVALAQAPGRGPRKPAAAMASPAPPVHFVLASTGNEARFVVREQLMIFETPNDAIGATTAIAGSITMTPTGKVDPAGSRITIIMDSLKSDKENRDSWIKSHTLRTDSFPITSIVVREIQGLPAKLPTSGTLSVKLLGDLTIHGVTRPWTWDVALKVNGNDYSGTATTHIKFGDFGMEQPRLMIVMSVVDDIKLQYDFHFVKTDG
jgi:polyisoprenoid-binding protein YceI